MKKNIFYFLFAIVLNASAQLNSTGDGFTLTNSDWQSNCYNWAYSNAGIMSFGNTLTQGPSFILEANGPYKLISADPGNENKSATWFAIPVITEEGGSSSCTNLFEADLGIDMSSNGRVTITAESSEIGAVLELYLGSGGKWVPATSTFSTGDAEIIVSHTFNSANSTETFTLDLSSANSIAWSSWLGKSKIQSMGFKSNTPSATFKVYEIKFGAEAESNNTGQIGQTSFEQLSLPPSLSNTNFFSVSTQQENLYVAGDEVLLSSKNKGQSWQIMYQESDVLFFDLKFANSKIGYAVGFLKSENDLNKHSLLYKTDDGGATWRRIFKSLRKRPASGMFDVGEMRNGAISLLDESRLIWGAGSNSFYTNTGGRSNHNTLASVPIYSAILPNPIKAFIGTDGLIESDDGGISYGGGGNYQYFDMDQVNTEFFYAIGTNVAGGWSVLTKRFVNRVNEYTSIDIDEATSGDVFYGIDFLDYYNGYIVGKNGKVFYTENSGDSWESLSSGVSNQLNDIQFYDSNNAIIVGNKGSLLRMTSSETISIFDAKVNYNESVSLWSTIASNTESNLFEVDATTNNIFVVGDGIILKSVDEGQSFNSVFEDSDYKFRDVSFANDNVGWAISYQQSMDQSVVHKTSNGGIDWEISTTLDGAISFVGLIIEAKDENFVFASVSVGLTNEKKYTINGGLTWNSVGTNADVAAISDFVYYGNNENINGYQGYGSSMSSGGSIGIDVENSSAWSASGCNSLTVPGAIKNYGMNAIATSSGHMAIARDVRYNSAFMFVEGYIERTEVVNPTKASDWRCCPTYTPNNMYGIKMISSDKIAVVGENGIIISTNKGGIISESSEPDPQFEWFGHDSKVYETLYDIEVINGKTAIVVGNKGTIVRTDNFLEESYVLSPPLESPVVATTKVSASGLNSVEVSCEVIFEGSNSISELGVCYSKSEHPTIYDNFENTSGGSSAGVFTVDLNSLIYGETYYIRSFAKNDVGISYGNVLTFKIVSSIPSVTTNSVWSVTNNFAQTGGKITDDGGSSIIAKGVCWNKTGNPTINSDKTDEGAGNSGFLSNLTNLNNGTKYYVRAYAINSYGTAYGQELSFTTTGTNSVTSITEKRIILYPNPTKNQFMLELTSEFLGKKFFIFDNKGKSIFEGSINSTPLEVNFGSFPKGNYTIVIGGIESISFIKN